MLSFNAPAKINWTLDILGKQENGYHVMDMLMQPISLCDELVFDLAEDLTLTGENRVLSSRRKKNPFQTEELHFDDSNLIIRSAKLLQQHCHVQTGASIHLIKKIPFGAGLGGGSADAAASLLALNRIWKLGLSLKELCELGLRLGADIPFMLHGCFARVGGIGEKIIRLDHAPEIPLLLLLPCGGLSTGKVFAAYDQTADPGIHPDTEKSLLNLQKQDLRRLQHSGGNVLRNLLGNLLPEIEKNIQMLYAVGASYADMTGSGCVVYGAFEDENDASEAEAQLRQMNVSCWKVKTLAKAWPFDDESQRQDAFEKTGCACTEFHVSFYGKDR